MNLCSQEMLASTRDLAPKPQVAGAGPAPWEAVNEAYLPRRPA
jgi:hypothetical protein